MDWTSVKVTDTDLPAVTRERKAKENPLLPHVEQAIKDGKDKQLPPLSTQRGDVLKYEDGTTRTYKDGTAKRVPSDRDEAIRMLRRAATYLDRGITIREVDGPKPETSVVKFRVTEKRAYRQRDNGNGQATDKSADKPADKPADQPTDKPSGLKAAFRPAAK